MVRLILQKKVDIAMSTQSIFLAGRQAGRVKLCPFLLHNITFIRQIERRSYDTG